MRQNPAPHIPAMLNEVLAGLALRDGGIYVDGTFGAGGYSGAILDAADCRLIAIDRDPDAVAAGASAVAKYDGRLTLVQGRFSEMQQLAAEAGAPQVQGVTLDLGVSSMQLDQASRGFSFAADGPLDMRMSKRGESAADVVNSRDQDELADIIYHYGDERRSRTVARAIIRAREAAPSNVRRPWPRSSPRPWGRQVEATRKAASVFIPLPAPSRRCAFT